VIVGDTKDYVMNVSSRRIDTHAHIGVRRGRTGRHSLHPGTQADYRSAVIPGTRSRILEVAVLLYRRLGHRKTTVIDIAHEISMSPANCYRFFRSKQAIKEAVVERLLEQVIVAAVDAARSDDSATVRLQAVLQEIERLHNKRFLQDKSLHDLVATAMRENWTSVRPYSERIEAVVAQVIVDGQGHGEFRNGDSMRAARCVLAATDCYTNPLLIGANASYARPTSGRMLEFCLRGLREV
jgi:AcrR family transcriptional regulator